MKRDESAHTHLLANGKENPALEVSMSRAFCSRSSRPHSFGLLGAALFLGRAPVNYRSKKRHIARGVSVAAIAFLVATLVACAARPVLPPTEPLEIEHASRSARALARDLAAKPNPTAWELAFSGWLAWMHEGDVDLAIERFEKALDIDSQNALAHFGLAEVASARLDEQTAARHLLSLLSDTPGDPLAEVALGSLRWILDSDTDVGDQSLVVLRQIEEHEEARPALRVAARELLAHRLEARGDDEAYTSLIAAGAPEEWTVFGPFSRFSALEPEAGEEIFATGVLEESYEGPLGEIAPWNEPTLEGSLGLLRAKETGDVYFAAVDLLVPEDGVYLFSWATRSQARMVLSGVELLSTDPISGRPPTQGIVKAQVAAGSHRLIVRLLSGVGGGAMSLNVFDSAGRPVDVLFTPAFGSPSSAWRHEEERKANRGRGWFRRSRQRASDAAVIPRPPSSLTDELQEVFAEDPSGALAAYLGALHIWSFDREGAKPLAESSAVVAPAFAPAHYLVALHSFADPSLPQDLRMGRANSAARTAAELDPLHGPSRLLAASIAVDQSRFEEAGDLLDEVAGMAPLSVDLLVDRAKLYAARGQPVLARKTLETGLASRPHHCGLLHWAYHSRRNDLDLGGADRAASLLQGCGLGSRNVWAEHLFERGEFDAAVEAHAEWTAARPGRFGERLRLADLLVASGRLDEAREELSSMRELWPRTAGLLLRLADVAARKGDDETAMNLRREYLALEPSALHVRRALAFQEGEELLDWAALDLDAAIESYQAMEGEQRWGTDAVLVVDHAAAEVFAEDPNRLAVVERVQMVTEVLTKQGLDQHGEVSIPAGAEIVALHTRKEDGRIFEPEITPHKDTITMAGLEAGDFVVIDYIVGSPLRSGALPGWVANTFYVRIFDVPLAEVSYVARAPAFVGLEVESRNVEVDEPVEEDGFLVFRYASQDVAPVLSEHDSPGADELLPWLRVGFGAGPEAYGDAWGDYVASRARVDHEVERFLYRAMADIPASVREDPRALTHALAEVVSRHVLGTTSSTELGQMASHVLVRGRGNRLVATKAVLSAAGIDSRIALVRPFDADPEERRFPAGDLYRYAVLRVDPGDGGPHIWLDQNVRTGPIGTLRPIHAGRPAILLAEPGRSLEIVTTPSVPRSQESRRSVLHLEVDESGDLLARGMDTYTGFWGAMVRLGMEQADDERRRQAVEASLSQSFGPVRLVDLSFEGADEDASPGSPMVVTYEFEILGWGTVGDGVIELPGGAFFPALISRRLVRLSERRLPMLLQSEPIRELEVTLALPEGYRLAEEPRQVNLRTSMGLFVRTLEREGAEVMISERLELELTRVSASEYPSFVAFAAAVDRAQAKGLVLEKARRPEETLVEDDS